MIDGLINPVALVPGLPLAGALLAAMTTSPRAGALICILAAAGGFAFATALPWEMQTSLYLLVDPLSVHVALLTAFVGLTSAIFSYAYIANELAAGRLDPPRVRQYHVLMLAFLGFMLLALLSNNLGVTWVALEAATIASVLVVGLPRTDNAVEASWKFFLICGVGIALALFGTVVLYLAALPALGPGYGAMSWSELARAAPDCRGTMLNLAFVFLLLGYGTKAGLAPLHGWMPDAHAEGPTPVSAVLSGSVLNVALVAILRLRGVMDANKDAIAPGPFIMTLGLLSLLLAAFSLWGRRDVKRFFAFSTHRAIRPRRFAFGLGGSAAIFAGLLHMTVHTLAKSALFQCVGRAAQRKGAQSFVAVGGLVASDRALGLTLAVAIAAVAGLPPFGLFTSEVLILGETLHRLPLLAPFVLLGLIVGGWALAARMINLCLGAPTPGSGPHDQRPRAGAGLGAPGDRAGAGRGHAERHLRLADRRRRGGTMTARALLRAAPTADCAPFRRHVLEQDSWAALVPALVDTPALDLLAMWADATHVHALFHDTDSLDMLPASVAVDVGLYPALSPARPGAAWFERMIRDLWGHTAADGLDQRPWLDHGNWPATPPLAARPLPNLAAAEPAEFLTAEGEGLHQIAVGPIHAGIIEPGHFRFTCNGETVVRLEIRLGYLHKGTLGLLRGKSPRAAARFAARLSGDSTVAHAIAFAHAAEAACGVAAPARAASLRAMMGELERIANHLGDIGGIVNDASFTLLQSRFVWQREAVLRVAARAFGHRLMMDAVIPGGVAQDLAPGAADAIRAVLDGIEVELPTLARIYGDTASLVDRVQGTGTLSPERAARFAAGGFVGRASGRAFDARRIPGYPPYDRLDVHCVGQEGGDVDARVRVRLGEIVESIRLLHILLAELPAGPLALPLPMATGEGIGWSEGFRGDIWHWLRLEGGLITAAFLADPSWRQWPLLEAAVEGNIVADFPLCNKSFNCSYSGVDL